MDGNLFWKLLKPEHARAQAFCRKLVGNFDDGDDLYQDALVKAITRLSSLRDQQAFRSWLYRIIINQFKSRQRRNWRRLFTPITPEIEDTIGGANPSLTHAARRKLQRAFQAIKPGDQALIVLFEIEGWSIAELAGLHRKSEGAIKVKLSRIRGRMRENLVLPQGEKRSNQKVISEEKICVATKPGLD